MASFYDKGDVGPDTDPDPIQGDNQLDDLHYIDQLFDGLEDDRYNQREPGLGAEFDGDDPSIWSNVGDAEEPSPSLTATPAVLSSEGAEILREIRRNELLKLRGIHIPSIIVPFGVDPATGEYYINDDSIPTFQESVAELEAIMAEVLNEDVPAEPVSEAVAEIADIPIQLIEEVAAEIEEGVVDHPVDTEANVTPNPVLQAVLERVVAIDDWWGANWKGEPGWWQDQEKLKAFLGISWDGFINDEGGPEQRGFSVHNPAWMSPDKQWDNEVPWYLQFDSALPAASYQWFTGDYGISLAERISGRNWTNMKVREDGALEEEGVSDEEFAAALDSPEDVDSDTEDPLSDSIFSALMEFSDTYGGSADQNSAIASFNIDDTSTGAWDEGLL